MMVLMGFLHNKLDRYVLTHTTVRSAFSDGSILIKGSLLSSPGAASLRST